MVASLKADLALLKVARADFHPKRNAFFNPLPFLDAATEVAVIDVHAESFSAVGLFAEAGGESLTGIDHCFLGVFLGRDGNDDNLLGRDARREDQAIVVGMRHDQGANQAGGKAPRSGVDMLLFIIAIDEGDVLRFRKILPEVVGGASLNGFAILYHRLDSESGLGAGEAFRFGFFAHDNRDGEKVAERISIELVNHARFFEGLFLCFVRGVSFLPEKFRRAQE